MPGVDGQQILTGIDLTIASGEVHAVMGPNGSGKSTLSYVLAGRDGYEVTGGGVLFDGRDLLAMAADERARAGVFLAFQYPVEIPGVPGLTFLKTALNAVRKNRGEAGARCHRVSEARAHEGACLGHRRRDAEAGPSTSASPAVRKSATRCCRWRRSSRGWRSSTRPTPAWTLTPSRSSPTALTRCATATEACS